MSETNISCIGAEIELINHKKKSTVISFVKGGNTLRVLVKRKELELLMDLIDEHFTEMDEEDDDV